MKLVCLNILGGQIFEPLLEFIKKEAQDSDIFCFQEMIKAQGGYVVSKKNFNSYSKISELLPEFQGMFFEMQENLSNEGVVDEEISWGLASFIRKTIPVCKKGDFFVYNEKNSARRDKIETIPAGAQFFTIKIGTNECTICNFHGMPIWPKTDTPARLRQSEIIVNFFKENNTVGKILCGDFNLFQGTMSLRMLEKEMKNLITDFDIKNTRSVIHKLDKNVSDYVIISPSIEVRKFYLPNVAISDHLPLILDFDL